MEKFENVAVRYARLSQLLTIRNLSKNQMISPSAISRFETNHYHLDKTYIIDLFRTLNIDYHQYYKTNPSFFLRCHSIINHILQGEDNLPKMTNTMTMYSAYQWVIEFWYLSLKKCFSERFLFLKKVLKYIDLEPPYSALLCFALAQYELYLDHETTSKDYLANYMQLCKDNQLPHLYLAWGYVSLCHYTYLFSDDFDEANHYLSLAQNLFQDTSSSILVENALSYHQFNLFLTQKQYDEAESLAQNHQISQLSIGQLYLALGNYEKAFPYLKNDYETNPDEQSRFYLCWCLYQLGNTSAILSIINQLNQYTVGHAGYQYLCEWLKNIILFKDKMHTKQLFQAKHYFKNQRILSSLVFQLILFEYIRMNQIQSALSYFIQTKNTHQVFLKNDFKRLFPDFCKQDD